jgi:hypothetical protein
VRVAMCAPPTPPPIKPPTRTSVQARFFGTSPFLQASDYQARALLSKVSTRVTLNYPSLTMDLSDAAVKALSMSGGNQFRVTLDPGSFSNFNGAFRQAFGADILFFHGPTAATSQVPRLVLTVTGPGPVEPVPAPVVPVSAQGIITSGSTTTVEATCNGGACGVAFVLGRRAVAGGVCVRGERAGVGRGAWGVGRGAWGVGRGVGGG